MRPTIKIDLKNNAFDFLRLLFALFVVFAHSRYLYGAEDFLHWNAKGFDNLHAGTIGVWGFFAISGFLVTTSWFNSKGAGDFFAKRFKRIFPGFWVSLLVCSFFFAPLWYFLKQHTLNDFFSNNAFYIWKFISSNLDSVITVQSIGSVAIDAINGPLWTVHHEVCAYIFLAALGILGFLRSKDRPVKGWMILAITLLINALRITYTYNDSFSQIYGTWFGDERFLLFLSIFMWGVTINLYKDLLVPHWPGALFSLTMLILGTKFEFLPIVLPFCFSYLIISLCFMLPFKNISKKIGDLSYGIYLYHWPVRLTLQMLGFQASLGLWSFIALNILIALPFAYLSWNLVEKRFLAHVKPQQNVMPEITPSETIIPTLN